MDGECPLIQEINTNNGVDRNVEPTKIFKGNAITISINYAQNVFYQKNDFCASVNIAIIRNKHLDEYSGRFICSILHKLHQRFTYTDKISKEIINNEEIPLPIDNDGNPNWNYMNEYMRDIEARTCDKISRLERVIRYRGCAIDVSNWKEFKVGELFDIYLSKDDIQPKNIIDGKTPLVSSGKDNNGIMAYIENDSAKLWNSNTLTVDMFGKVFYQPNSYYCVSHGRVNILVPKNNMEKYELMFIATTIEMITLLKYSFTQMCTSKKLKNDIIYLPTRNGSLDCNYMEAFMKNIEKQVKEKIMIV